MDQRLIGWQGKGYLFQIDFILELKSGTAVSLSMIGWFEVSLICSEALTSTGLISLKFDSTVSLVAGGSGFVIGFKTPVKPSGVLEGVLQASQSFH